VFYQPAGISTNQSSKGSSATPTNSQSKANFPQKNNRFETLPLTDTYEDLNLSISNFIQRELKNGLPNTLA
jgi:hypothetical protein